jgi:hypothetical protein
VSEPGSGAGAVGDTEAVPPHHPVLAVLLVAAGVALVALTAATSYSLASMYGSEGGGAGTVLIWALLPAAVLASGLRHAFQTFARRSVGWPRLLLLSYLVAAVAIGLGTWIGSGAVTAASSDGDHLVFTKGGVTVLITQWDAGMNYTDFTAAVPPED